MPPILFISTQIFISCFSSVLLDEKTDLIKLVITEFWGYSALPDCYICIWKNTVGKGRMFYTKDLILDDVILSMEPQKEMAWQWVLLSYDR